MPERKRLPSRRYGYNQKCSIGKDLKLYIRTGEYEDGTLGEVFVDVDKQGTMIRALMSCFCIAVSIALQYGCPLEVLANQFVGSRFEPAGPVGDHSRIKNSSSILDLIFRDLMINYAGKDELAHVPLEKGE